MSKDPEIVMMPGEIVEQMREHGVDPNEAVKMIALEGKDAKPFLDAGITQEMADGAARVINDPEHQSEYALRAMMLELVAIFGSNIETAAYYKKHLGKVLERYSVFVETKPRHPDMATFAVAGIISSTDSKPLVNLSIQGEGAVLYTQVSIIKAYEIAQAIIEAAEAAITDTFILEFAKDRLDVDDNMAASIMSELRDFRKQHPIRRGWSFV